MAGPEGNARVSPFDALMDAAVDAIIIISQAGIIRRFNNAAENMFGYSEEEIRGQNVKVLMPEPHGSRHDEYLKAYAETGVASIIGQGREETGLRSNGETFPMQLSVGAIKQDGDSGHFVGIIRDISEVRAVQEQVRQLEEQLLHADRLVILGELTAGIAHEINQPLTAIAAYADAGRSMIDRHEKPPRDDMHSICERIGEQSRRAGEVVRRLRKLVRSGSIAKASHDINQIIRNILLLFEYEINKSKVELVYYPLDPPENLYVDEIQIQQVLVNLVKNSLDALAESESTKGRIEIRASLQDADVEISVSDNGPGVAAESQSQLFEPFFTTKPKGVGLGLSICKNIITAHGGSLQHSQPATGGCSFTVSLPLKLIG